MNKQELSSQILDTLHVAIEAGTCNEATKGLALGWLEINGTDYAPVVVMMNIYPEKFIGQTIEQVEAKLAAYSA